GAKQKYMHEIEGVNSRLDSIQAAVLGVKLKYIDEWNEKRRKNAQLYTDLLKDAPGVTTPFELENTKPVYHLYVIQLDNRDELIQKLTAHGIATGIHYPFALHLLPAYQHLGLKEGSYPEAEKVAGRFLSLPMYPELSESQIEYVCDTIKSLV
ncbi:MAG: DegT/DnrJ/EryC1/StrS family aminotransferase, partial [bacterium]|nr:DegT/DnrJ/EryC1/StrS family aminotransferase [bacterium]